MRRDARGIVNFNALNTDDDGYSGDQRSMTTFTQQLETGLATSVAYSLHEQCKTVLMILDAIITCRMNNCTTTIRLVQTIRHSIKFSS